MNRIGIFLLKKFSVTRRLWQGFLGLVVLGIAAYGVTIVWAYPAKLAELIATVWWQETLLVVGIIASACYLAGLGIDGLRRTRWGHALDHLPTAILEKPEVLVRFGSGFVRGIFLGTASHELRSFSDEPLGHAVLAEIFLPTGGPLNPGATAAIILVPFTDVLRDDTTGNGHDLLQQVITLGGANGSIQKPEAHTV